MTPQSASALRARWPHADAALAELLLLDLGRRAGHRVEPRLVLREGDGVAQVRLAREDHHHAVDPEGDPPVRRRSHRERVEEEAELHALLLLRQLEDAEDARLEVGLVHPERAAAEPVS